MESSNQPFPTTDTAFYRHVVGALADLKAGQAILSEGLEAVCKRLDKVNGSVSHLYKETELNKEGLLSHVITCPQVEKIIELDKSFRALDHNLTIGSHPGSSEVRKRIETLERIAATQSEKEKISASISGQWKDKLLYPLIRIIGTGIAILLLLHAQDLLHK